MGSICMACVCNFFKSLLILYSNFVKPYLICKKDIFCVKLIVLLLEFALKIASIYARKPLRDIVSMYLVGIVTTYAYGLAM